MKDRMKEFLKYGLVFSGAVSAPAYFLNEDFASGVLFNTILWMSVACVRRYVCRNQKLQNQK